MAQCHPTRVHTSIWPLCVMFVRGKFEFIKQYPSDFYEEKCMIRITYVAITMGGLGGFAPQTLVW